jgi:AhpD family alkylhydroperoxidase
MAIATTSPRIARSDVKRILPGYYAAVTAIDTAAASTGLGEALLELVHVRVSQLNGCAYCVHSHTAAARKAGVEDDKLVTLVTWEEAEGIFDERERAALAWADSVTLMSQTHVPDEAFAAVSAVFDKEDVIALTAAIAATNVWNRIAVPFRYTPGV